MIKQFFSNHKQFAFIYFLMLFIDVFVKLNCDPFPYRFMSKPWLTILLFVYFYYNAIGKNDKKNKFVFFALVSFLLGDLVSILNVNNIFLIILTILFFTVAKIFLSLKFSHNKDFSISRLIPFTIILFAYTVFLIWFLYDNLKTFFIPALVTFFISLLMLQFAFLRQPVVNKRSFIFVFFGAMFFIVSEGIQAVLLFKTSFPMEDVLTMLFYGTGVYLIVSGIIKEEEDFEIGQLDDLDGEN